jgi:hypothetical protein
MAWRSLSGGGECDQRTVGAATGPARKVGAAELHQRSGPFSLSASTQPKEPPRQRAF